MRTLDSSHAHPSPRQRGFTLLEVTIALVVIGVLAGMSVPILIGARKRANEANAIVALRVIHTAQSVFAQRDKDGDGETDFAASLAELRAAGNLIGPVLASGAMHGYHFAITPGPANLSWSATADPVHPGRSGERYFWIDERGVIRYSTDATAGPADPVIGE